FFFFFFAEISLYTYLFTPRGPQMFTCLTYLERNVRVDCEFLASDLVPGPYCEYRQDSRLVGSTYPNAVVYVATEDRRRSNVSLVAPNLCRLTWAPMADEKPYTYTCRVYQVKFCSQVDKAPSSTCLLVPLPGLWQTANKTSQVFLLTLALSFPLFLEGQLCTGQNEQDSPT
uniref:Si:ch211-215c18.3 n=1 Tax=Fundulus heteroclitus TaxID=8078 RepID=A0A3Q2Q8L9_FUNHE